MIDIGSAIVAVSFDKAESYYQEEIVNEGVLRTDVANTVLMPADQVSKVKPEWVTTIFNKMHTARDMQSPELTRFSEQYNVDVGLIDIQIFFNTDASVIHSILDSEGSDSLLRENLKHLDLLIGSVLHDQMTITTAMHSLTPLGKFEFHYHNVIFSLRQENENYCALLMKPIFDALGQADRKISVVA